MTIKLDPYVVTQEPDMQLPHHFRNPARLRHVDKPLKAEVINVIRLTEMEKLFHVRIVDDKERENFSFRPGQFVLLEVPGYGEIPISISGSYSNKGYIELCIRKVGSVTNVLHKVSRGAMIGIRGPLGTHFPLEKMVGHNVLLIAGGLGLAPLRAPIFYVTENRSQYKAVHIIYGTKDPSQLLFDYQYDQWRRIDGVDLHLIVERPDEHWKGDVGMIPKLLPKMDVPMEESYAVVCGPPVMFKFVCHELSRMGMPMERMFVSLERRMHCGMGKCCRCNIGSTYTCIQGPVFDYWSVMNLKEAI
ncbi:FAD/NAD(P)-binding protein [candidate division KSB1 bacterium]